jgi:hypothetical protein
MGTLKFDCLIVGVVTQNGGNFARVEVQNDEILVPIPVEIFHEIPFSPAVLTLEFKNERIPASK